MNNPLYKFAINNIARRIRSVENKILLEKNSSEHLNVFRAANILATAFCKVEADVVLDITLAEID
jgi:hypothetical protein